MAKVIKNTEKIEATQDQKKALKTNKAKEVLSDKSMSDLVKLLDEKRLALDKLVLNVLQKKEKNVKKAGFLKKEIARLLTEVNKRGEMQ